MLPLMGGTQIYGIKGAEDFKFNDVEIKEKLRALANSLNLKPHKYGESQRLVFLNADADIWLGKDKR
jgi:hypothetical protein